MYKVKVVFVLIALAIIIASNGVIGIQESKAEMGIIYISPDGSDVSGDGSLEKPWSTLKHAVGVAKNGDTVHALKGAYKEPSVIVPPGINIEGDGYDKTIFYPDVTTSSIQMHNGFIYAATQGTQVVSGNQKFSNFSIINVAAKEKVSGGIVVAARNNVKIQNVRIQNTKHFGILVVFGFYAGAPKQYLKGIEISNCYLVNCSDNYGGNSSPALGVAGLDGGSIHDNFIDGRDTFGNGIGYWMWGGLKNSKFFNNTVLCNHFDPNWGSPSSMTFFNIDGTGNEVYNNYFNEWTSFVDADEKMSKTGSIGKVRLDFHDNIIESKKVGNGIEAFELNMSDVLFQRNHIINFGMGLVSYNSEVIENIIVRNNVFRNASNEGSAVLSFKGRALIQNFKFYSNTVDDVAHLLYNKGRGDVGKGINGLEIKNNSIMNVRRKVFEFFGFDNLNKNILVENNNIYKCNAMGDSKLLKSYKSNSSVNPQIIGIGEKSYPFYRFKSTSVLKNIGSNLSKSVVPKIKFSMDIANKTVYKSQFDPISLEIGKIDTKNLVKVEYYATDTKKGFDVYQGGFESYKIGEANSAPYSLKWIYKQPGNYVIKAKAIYKNGDSFITPNINITIKSVSELPVPIKSTPKPQNEDNALIKNISNSNLYILSENALATGEEIYSDRQNQVYSKLPDSLKGKTYIKVSQTEKTKKTTEETVSFTAVKEITVYIALLENQGGDYPKWTSDEKYSTLLKDYQDTGMKLTKYDKAISQEAIFNIYSKKFKAGERVTFTGAENNYSAIPIIISP